MIKKFKQFNERLIIESSVQYELVDYLDDETIEKYYDDNFYMDAKEIIDLWPDILFNHVDDDRFVEDWKDDEKSNREISEYDEYEFKPFIEENLSDEKMKRIKEIYREKEGIEEDIKSINDGVVSINEKGDVITITDDEGYEEEYEVPDEHEIKVHNGQQIKKGEKLTKLYYDDEMLDKLDADEMRNVIEYDDDEEKFIDDLVESWYDYNTDAKDIIENIYGDPSRMSGDDLYRIFINYIDENDIVEEYKSNEDFSHKKETVADSIEDSIELQEEILQNNRSSVLSLAELFKNNPNNNNISNDYDFQKAFIEEYVIENGYEDGNDEEKNDLIAEALKILKVDYKFELDGDIEDEYSKQMWKADSIGKYNL